MLKKIKNTLICCLIGLVIGLIGFLFDNLKLSAVFNILYSMELKSINSRYEFKELLDSYSYIKQKPDVTIIAIDEASFNSDLKEFKEKNISRSTFSELILKLKKLKVSTIGFDLLFTKNSNPHQEENKRLVHTIKSFKKVVLASKQVKYQNSEGYSLLLPFEGSLDEKMYGIVNVIPDIDGFIRRYHHTISRKIIDFNTAQEKIIFDKTFDTAIALKYLPQKTKDNILFDNSNKNRYIDFKAPGKAFKIYSISTFFMKDYMNKLDPDDFKDKIILIGDTQPSNHDYYNIPLERQISGTEGIINENSMAGVEVHANIIQTIIDNNTIQEYNPIFNVIIVCIVCIILAMALSVTRSFFVASIELIGIALLYSTSTYILFYTHGLILSLAFPLIQILLTGIFSWGFMFIAVNKQKNIIYKNFQKYVSPEIAKIASDNISYLSGKRKKITILFSDIEDFTPLCESIPPTDLIYILNTYFAKMGKIVLNNKGTIDKYIGDSVMAFWGAPIDISEPEVLACKTALDMKKELESLNAIYNDKGLPPIKIRIGINTDDVIVGNIGGDSVNYTAVGDGVNLASRIEGANKLLNTSILIGENTYEMVKNKFICRYINEITVKGKTTSVKVYELLTQI